MGIFNESVQYIVSEHAIQRYIARFEPTISEQEARHKLYEAVKNGILLFDDGKHRYIRYKGLILPLVCINENTYKIKTSLTLKLANRFLKWREKKIK